MHKIVIIFLTISLNICLGAQKNRLIKTVLLSTHNICFGWETKTKNTNSYLEACVTMDIGMVNVLKFRTFFSFCSQIKCWVIKAGIHINACQNSKQGRP